MLVPAAATATPLVNDYPSYLRAQPRDALVDPWYFYNRECTSFVAWRLTNDNKIPFTNNWAGAHFGNAYQWAAAARQLGFAVNPTPAVGAVAWWAQGSSGSRLGHVAWVAKVYSDNSILVEEYNYLSAGNYDQRHLYPGTSAWPSDFLHLGDLALKNTVAPKIPGTPTVGVAVTASTGTWTPAGSQSFSYAWYANGTLISGAKSQKYTPTPAMLGKKLTVKVTASMGGAASKSVTSVASAAVVAGTLVESGTPVVVGAAQVGVPLVAQGTWKPSPALSYQWYSNGVAVPNATGPTYTPQPSDLGSTISVQVTATATGYKVAKATMSSASKVVPGVFANSKVPIITGKPTVGTPLAASTGTWSPTAAYTYQWYTGSTAISGATTSTYTPTPSLLSKTLSVKVTASATGYTSKTAASAVSAAVLPGTFTAGALAALPTPAVGAPLTIQPGTITGTTTPTVTYQWNLAGKAIHGATSATYTPLPSQLNKQLSVTVTASAPGYTTLTRTTALSKAVQLGTLRVITQPAIGNSPRYGQSDYFTPAVWSATPGTVTYQWYANGRAITGATGTRYVPSTSMVGQTLSVTESVTSPGYHNASITLAATSIAMGGTTSLSSHPTISGDPVVGSLLTASAGAPFPSDATRSVQWLSNGVPIAKATGWTYRPTTADITHTISVRITVSRSLWTTSSSASSATEGVRSPAKVIAHLTRLAGGKVRVTATISAPGVSGPAGHIEIRRDGKVLASNPVVNGTTTFVVPVSTSIQRLTVVYGGDRRLTWVWQFGVLIQ